MNELETLLNLEKQNPSDDNLLSQIALTYVKTPFNQNNDLKYFKKAYKANQSIKNTHNYAFWANGEYGEDELALGLFKELMDKNPKSFYPYMAYADIFTSRISKFTQLEKAKNNSNILIMLYQRALELFDDCPNHYQNSHYHEYAKNHNHINGIENFWSQSKCILRKYNGIDKKHFYLFLKECEFRFNYGTPSEKLRVLRKWCDV